MKTFRFFAFLLIPLWFFLQWIAENSTWIDTWYANGLYKWLSPFTLAITAWVPFSVGDIFYIAAILYLLFALKHLPKWFRWKRLVRALGILSIILLVFHIQWGLHYHRTSLSEKWNLKTNYSIEELNNLTQNLINKSNLIHTQLVSDSTVGVTVPYSQDKLLNIATRSIQKSFDYPRQNIKASLLSMPLTYMGYSGYLNPFTLEAQVNNKQPKLRILTTATHEIAHQLGYAAEEEANFVGISVAMNADDAYMRYAGHTLALQYCLRALRKSDMQLYEKAVSQMNTGILKNYQEIQAFWSSYQNPLEPLFKNTYDQYLKANNQTAGIASYNLVVGLLLHDFTENQSTTRGAPAASSFSAN